MRKQLLRPTQAAQEVAGGATVMLSGGALTRRNTHMQRKQATDVKFADTHASTAVRSARRTFAHGTHFRAVWMHAFRSSVKIVPPSISPVVN